jgi:hypothetical protein
MHMASLAQLHPAINLNGGTIQAAARNQYGVGYQQDHGSCGGVTLDTNGANTFSLYGSAPGTGTYSLANTEQGLDSYDY